MLMLFRDEEEELSNEESNLSRMIDDTEKEWKVNKQDMFRQSHMSQQRMMYETQSYQSRTGKNGDNCGLINNI